MIVCVFEERLFLFLHHRSLTERRSSLPLPFYINTVYLFPTLCSTGRHRWACEIFYSRVQMSAAVVEACFRVVVVHVVQFD